MLDRSGSINDNGPDAYENAAKAFVNDLVNTNTSIGIVSFANTASTDSGYQNLTGGVGTLITTITGVYNNLGGGTNWDAGLRQVNGFGRTRTSSSSSPTVTRLRTRGGGGSTGEVNWPDFTEAVTSANYLKSGDGDGPPSRIIAIGAGAAGTISEENFWGVAGPVTGQANILANDYIVGSTYDLGDALRALALARCGSSVKVWKQIETSPGVWSDGQSWSFNASVTGNPTITPTPPARYGIQWPGDLPMGRERHPCGHDHRAEHRPGNQLPGPSSSPATRIRLHGARARPDQSDSAFDHIQRAC